MLDELIAIEEAELGYREGSGNITKYGAEYGLDGQPWCVMFQWWCAKRAGVPFPNTAHCNGVESYAKEHGQWVTNDFAVGDFVIFDYEKDGNRDHIGLVVEVDGGRVKTTIEGNYADKVARVNRRSDCSIVGAYRPRYEDTTPHQSAEPTASPQGEAYGGAEEPPPQSAELTAPPIQVEPLGDDTSSAAEAAQTTPQSPAATAPLTQGSQGLPVLRQGDYGEAVGSLQSLLRYHGYKMKNSFITVAKPDCEFGGETEAALLDFCGKDHTDDEVWKKLIGGLG